MHQASTPTLSPPIRWLVTVCWLISLSSYGQQVLSLKEIPSLVEARLPAIQAAKAGTVAANEQIAQEKRTLAPELTLGYQVNIATYNNITGMSYPGLFMPISGPPSRTNTLDFTPGSAATALVTWTPLTFGQRATAVERATAQYQLAGASYQQELFRYQHQAIAAYMEAVYYQQLLSSHRANIRRYTGSLEQALVLARTGLKPGVDTLQLQSAIAQAEIDLLQTERIWKGKLIELANLTGTSQHQGIAPAGTILRLSDSTFYQRPVTIDTAINFQAHPAYQVAQAQTAVSAAELETVEKSWRPRLDIWGNLYGRGSGVDAEGNVDDRSGLRLTRHNIGAGAQLSLPLLQLYRISPKKKYYQQLVKAEEFKVQQLSLELKGQAETALEQYRYQTQIVSRTGVRLETASEAFESLRLSYESGLVDFTRLLQAQYELQQAEINHTAAQLLVWRSLLEVSAARGDLTLFLQQLP